MNHVVNMLWGRERKETKAKGKEKSVLWLTESFDVLCAALCCFQLVLQLVPSCEHNFKPTLFTLKLKYAR